MLHFMLVHMVRAPASEIEHKRSSVSALWWMNKRWSQSVIFPQFGSVIFGFLQCFHGLGWMIGVGSCP